MEGEGVMNKPTFGSLFAGVGGFDLGFEAAGWKCSFQVEWDKNCQQTLAYHWPDVPRWSDVCDVNGAELPPVDCITFGSPCQDLSVAGKRAGLAGEKSSMFFEAMRIIKEMRNATGNVYPRYIIWENVVGALSSRNGDDFEAVLREMADAGATFIEWAVLDAQFFGVPQRRRRVFVIAGFDSAKADGSGQEILSVSQSGGRHSASRRESGQEFADEIDDSIESDSQQLDFFAESSYGTYLPGVATLRAASGTLGGGSETLIVDSEAKVINSLCASDWKGVGNQYVADGKLVIQ
jgi:DNA (cytosine-5)-methyltransferase 1